MSHLFERAVNGGDDFSVLVLLLLLSLGRDGLGGLSKRVNKWYIGLGKLSHVKPRQSQTTTDVSEVVTLLLAGLLRARVARMNGQRQRQARLPMTSVMK